MRYLTMQQPPFSKPVTNQMYLWSTVVPAQVATRSRPGRMLARVSCPDLHMLQTVLLYPDKKQHNRPSFCFFHSPLLPLFAISLFFLSLSSPSHTCRFHIEGVEEDLIEYLQIRKTEDGKFQLSGQVRKKKRTRTAVAEMLSLTAGI